MTSNASPLPAYRMTSPTSALVGASEHARSASTAGVDVVITCYQYGRFLQEAAASVLTQNVPNLRLLIIDNASTDGSQEIARRIAAKDKRVTLMLNEHNRGYHDSFNRAIDWAKADCFVILDADDLLSPGSLARGIEVLAKNPNVSLAYGLEGRLVDNLLDPARSDSATTGWNITTGTSFIRQTCWDSFCDIGAPAVIRRTSAQKRAGYFRETLVRTSDFEMYLRLAMVGDIASTTRLQGIRRIHGGQQSTPYMTNPVRDFEEHQAAFESFFSHEGSILANSEELKVTARHKLGDHAYWYAVWQALHRMPGASETFRYAAERRSLPNLVPPVSFLWKRRWLRSLYRVARRKLSKPVMLSPMTLPSRLDY